MGDERAIRTSRTWYCERRLATTRALRSAGLVRDGASHTGAHRDKQPRRRGWTRVALGKRVWEPCTTDFVC
jgi:hypothetical protein